MVVGAALSACGGGSSSQVSIDGGSSDGGSSDGGSRGNSIDGRIRGQGFAIQDAISASVLPDASGRRGDFGIVQLTSTPGACDDGKNDITRPSEKVVNIEVFDWNGSSKPPSAPGTYTVVDVFTGTPVPKTAHWYMNASDAVCKYSASDSATAESGSVTLTVVDGDRFSGTFDVTLDTGERVTGSFDPQPCPAGFHFGIPAPTCM